jgi:L-fuculose-phosphate aldolase
VSGPVDEARAAVAGASRRLAAEGLLIGTSGNVSVVVDELVAVTATGADLSRITPVEVSVVDRSGRVVAGDLAPTSELDLHLGVYARHDARAVVHTHAPAATALSCVLEVLPCIHYQQLLLGGDVRVAPYATFGTAELAASVVDALAGRSAALMANHGSVTTGASIDKAVENALLLEWLCTVFRAASCVGQPRVLDEEQQAAVVHAAIERKYGTTRHVTDTPAETKEIR